MSVGVYPPVGEEDSYLLPHGSLQMQSQKMQGGRTSDVGDVASLKCSAMQLMDKGLLISGAKAKASRQRPLHDILGS